MSIIRSACCALSAALLLVGCTESLATEPVGSPDESALRSSADETGIAPGSLEEEGVLLLVNDRAVDETTLAVRTGLSQVLADAIVAGRKNPDGSPRWFSSISAINDLPDSDRAAFESLVVDANANGYIELPGFDPPTAARLSVRDGLRRPPTSRDVTVEAGFDGKTPDEVVTLVKSRLTNALDDRNDQFVTDTITATHKAFTIAVGNVFATGPTQTFVGGLQADSVTMLGVMSVIRPTILMTTKAGKTQYYARGTTGEYEAIAPPSYAIAMRARIALQPQGVRVFYPAWASRGLAGRIVTVTEH